MTATLKQIPLAKTQLTVSQLCLGTNQFGTGLDAARAAEILDVFTAAGGNFLDTAHSYGDWIPTAPRAASEGVLGQWLKHQKREKYVLATKGCEFDYRAGDFALRVTPALLEEDLLGSLERLQVATIDLYWLHRDDPSRPVQIILDALMEHQRAGRIRHFGCSNWSVARIEEAQRYAASIGHEGFVACQPMWGLAEPDRTAMQSYAPGGHYEDGYAALHAAGLAMIPYSGQSRGFFTKVAAGGKDALGADVAALYYNERNLHKLTVIEQVAARHDASINDVVLAYLTSQPHCTIPIIGCSRPEQLAESISACALRLSAEELQQLQQA
jgi:aryl-alcohol dehydrogenase-like predicted oxidoreductase